MLDEVSRNFGFKNFAIAAESKSTLIPHADTSKRNTSHRKKSMEDDTEEEIKNMDTNG
jgi:hypothetical protein